MSQSPLDDIPVDENHPYSQGDIALAEFVRQGRSFSGHERNCCFLNTGGMRFADVSAAVGLDFPDDGRGAAVVDWDQDGRLDLWVTNRSAPCVRLLRNTLQSDNHYVAVRLVGRNCNRDAIGARVELHLGGTRPRRLGRSLHAGDCFLSQSSKWLHFGLGDCDSVERLVVQWPGGDLEEVTGLDLDRRYRIIQGTGVAEQFERPGSRPVNLVPSQPELPSTPNRTAVIAPKPDQMSELTYLGFDGQTETLSQHQPNPVLINLWATWCAPCIEELHNFVDQAERLREHGLTVLLLNVDNVENPASSAGDVLARLEAINVPFPTGLATNDTLGELERTQREFMARIQPLAVPASFLIDEQNQLVAMYRGTVSVDRLLADLELADADINARVHAAVSFPGQWTGLWSTKWSPENWAVFGQLLFSGRQFLTYVAAMLAVLAFCAYLAVRFLRKKGSRTRAT